MLGPKVRKGKWLAQSLTGGEADAIRAEYEVGRDVAHEIRGRLGLDTEPLGRQLLAEIGTRLTARVANKAHRFAFDALAGAEPNAFALPGGFVFVTRAMLDLCDRDHDELAFILGHEMAHVIKGHAIERVTTSAAISVASLAAPVRGILGAWVRRVGVDFVTSAYSRDRELEADTLGARLAQAAGYDPSAAARLLSRLASPEQPTGNATVGDYFSSHPPAAVRIRNVNCLLRA